MEVKAFTEGFWDQKKEMLLLLLHTLTEIKNMAY